MKKYCGVYNRWVHDAQFIVSFTLNGDNVSVINTPD